MKVKDAIKKLQEMDQEAELIITSDNFELNHSTIPVQNIHHYKTGKKEVKTFRDAFDGETYQREIWSVYGGKLSVVNFTT